MENIKLQNVDPATFLRSFNKLVDYYDAKPNSQTKFRGLSQIALQPLTKFPIRKQFEKIEGIYTNVSEKRMEDNDRAKQKFNVQDEEFMKRHNQFMRRTLTRMIEDNKEHIGTIQKSKTFYLLKEARKKNLQKHVRLASRELRDVGSAGTDRPQTERDQVATRAEMYQTDPIILNTDSYKNPKPISFKGKETEVKQGIKMKSPEEVERLLAQKRSMRVSELQPSNFVASKQYTRTASIASKSQSPVNTLTKRSQSLLGNEFASLFQSRTSKVEDVQDSEQDLFDPEKYIKGRFQDPSVQLRYDYERGQKQMSEKFKKRLAYHYINDEKLI